MNLLNSNNFIYIFRLLLASICGIIIGLERKNRSKEAGIRTHCVVACAAALMMLISKYAFFDVIGEGMYNGVEVRLDPSRVASTIASGIGFLGAGMIFVHKNNVSGLTTAAGIWATSGIGMAIGAGMYVVGIGVTLIIFAVQILMHMDFRKNKGIKLCMVTVDGVDRSGYKKFITEEFEKMDIVITDMTLETKDNVRTYNIICEIPTSLDEDEIVEVTGYNTHIKLA